MPSASLGKSSTPVSTISSLATTDTTGTTTTVAQSGPYTKAQFLNTVEGSRSVKNASEVEQLLRDYPAALELYRTGRYKVKVKYEADVERVILVEKRVDKNASNPAVKATTAQENNPPVSNGSTNVVQPKADIKRNQNIAPAVTQPHSQDRATFGTSGTDDNAVVQTAGTLIRVPSNTQPKVDHHRTSSKELKGSSTLQSKEPEQMSHEHRRGRPRDSSPNVSHHKHKGKKGNRDYTNAVVPYEPRAHHNGDMWHPSRALQPYYSYPTLQQQQQSHYYGPPIYGSQQNSYYPQPYYYGQQPPLPVTYQKPHDYPIATTVNSKGRTRYPPTPWTEYNSAHGPTPPSSYQPFLPNQQQYSYPQPTYQSQVPYQPSVPWPLTAYNSARPVINSSDRRAGSRRASKQRNRSVDTDLQSHPPNPNQALPPVEHRHHRHHHRQQEYHTQPPSTNGQVINVPPPVQTVRNQNVPLKETTTTATHGNHNDKLTIRQLNEIFLQTDPSGRLPYSSVPSILQRFGVSLGEKDLTSAAQELQYNVHEPITARRLVHVLMKLGKIAKSTHHQTSSQQQKQPQSQPRPASPTILPEDREVIDIMAQHRTPGIVSTHIHSSIYPNQWH